MRPWPLSEFATDAKNKVQAADTAFSDKTKNVVLSSGSSEVDLKEAIKKATNANYAGNDEMNIHVDLKVKQIHL